MNRKKELIIGNLTAKVPVIQGGMGVGVSLSSLAGNVARCGGIGLISTAQIGWREADFKRFPRQANFRALQEEVKKAREIAKGGIIGVNIMVATKGYDEYVKEAVKAGVDVIVSGAGLPIDLPKLVEGSQVKIAPIISNEKGVKVICKMYLKKYNRIPDFIVIEGPKAGGHLGFKKDELEKIEELHYEEEIKRIISYVRAFGEEQNTYIPVVVAGGIFDGEAMKEALSLGADGVQVATRFVTTYECDASTEFKQAYINAKKEDIEILQSPVGMPGRAINNPFMKRSKQGKIPIDHCYQCISTCKPKEIPYCITNALVQSVKGNTDNGLMFCGSNAYRCTKLEHVKDIMKEFEEACIFNI